MSLFDTLKNAIFGHSANAATKATPSPLPTSTPGATTTLNAGGAPISSASPPPAATTTSAPATQVDVAANLDAMNQRGGQVLNWRTSIVDLMRLVGMDSSLQHRKDLAKELGYTGSTDDSAAMNMWLHKRVMQQLAQNGGKVPDALLH